MAVENCSKILKTADMWGADMIVSSCPLCEFNLGKMQAEIRGNKPDLKEVPTLYFTQLLAIALGITPVAEEFKLNRESSIALLQQKNLIAAETA
jgi:heterodisulfide reductase subunit B